MFCFYWNNCNRVNKFWKFVFKFECLKSFLNICFNFRSESVAATGRLVGSETFLSFAFVNMLLDIAINSKDPNIILEGLKIVAKQNFPTTTDQVN